MELKKELLKEIIFQIRNKEVLDIGSSGQGNPESSDKWLFRILRRNSKLIKGIDTELCQDSDVYQADVQNFDLETKFDIVTMLDVIEHLDNVGLALKNIRKHLNEKGKLLITTPNINTIGSFWDTITFRGVCGNPTHTLGFNEKMIRHLLARNGFRIKKLKYK